MRHGAAQVKDLSVLSYRYRGVVGFGINYSIATTVVLLKQA